MASNADSIKELYEAGNVFVAALAGRVGVQPNESIIKAAKDYKKIYDKITNKNHPALREDSFLCQSALSIAKKY